MDGFGRGSGGPTSCWRGALVVASSVARPLLPFGGVSDGVAKEERERIAREYLALAKLPEAAERYPNELSGGVQHRVGVLRAPLFV